MANPTRRSILIGSAIMAVGLSELARGRPLVRSIAQDVSAILARSSTNTYLQSKLALDALIAAPSPSVIPEIDRLADAVRQMAGPNPTDRYKLAAIRKTIYEGGLWNRNRPFSYDQADPFGNNVRNKLLDTYFQTRLGNCVSMPILFLILAERAGLNASLATAPLHVFVRYIDPSGAPFNAEATSGGHFAREEWYRQQMPMTDRAIESGIYMRTLTKRESVAVMASTLVDYLMTEHRHQEVIDVADVILAANPRDVYAMLKKGTAAGELLRLEFTERYPVPAAIPPSLRPRYQMLAQQNAQAFAEAEALGWTPPS